MAPKEELMRTEDSNHGLIGAENTANPSCLITIHDYIAVFGELRYITDIPDKTCLKK